MGTTAPGEKLQVNSGNVKIEAGAISSVRGLIIAHTGQTGNQTLLVQNTSGTPRGHLYTTERALRIEAGEQGSAAGGTLDFWVNQAERMRIDVNGVIQLPQSGNTGFINYNSQDLEFDINRNPETGTFSDTAKSHARISLSGPSGGSNITFKTAAANNTVATEKMRILANGNVGIGVTNPGNKLRVEGSVRINDSGDGQLFFGTGSLNKIELDGTDMKLWSGGLVPTITMSNQGLIKFGIYGLGGTGTPNNLLGVDSSGNVVKTSSFNVELDDTPASGTASGNIVKWSVSETVTAGTLYAVKTNGGWTAADADTEAKSIGLLAIALGSNATAGMLLQGFFYKASHGFTIGLPLYISNTTGAFSTTRPTGINDYVRIIGYATSTNHIYFDPDKTFVKLSS